MGKVVKCAERKFPTSIVNLIMQYQTLNPNIPALRWGRKNEDKAISDYKTEMVQNHGDFEMHTVGLLISTKYPFLGATPDGVVSCSCCGSGLLEVKCPYKYRDIIPSDITDANFCLQTQPDGTKVLNQTHNGTTCRQQKPCQKYAEILNYLLNKHKIILITAKIRLKYTEPDRTTTTLH